MDQTRPISLPAAQLGNPGVATELVGAFLTEKAACLTHFSSSQIPPGNFRFAGASKRKVLKYEFMKSNHFGLSSKKTQTLKCWDSASLTTQSSLETWQEKPGWSGLYLMVSKKKQEMYWKECSSWFYGWCLIFGHSWTPAYKFVTICFVHYQDKLPALYVNSLFLLCRF